MKNYFNFLLFWLLALMWSASFINIKIAISVFPPVFSASIRVLIAFVCLTLLFLCQRRILRVSFGDGWRLWITGIFTQGLPFALLFYGERYVSPALASVLNSTVSIWALLLGALFFRDFSQWTSVKMTGLLLGLVGVVFIFWPMLISNGSTLIGTLSIIGMAVSYAIGALLNQHLVFDKMQTSLETNVWQQTMMSLLFLIIVSLMLEPLPSYRLFLDIKILGAFLYLGILATAAAWLMYFHLIKHWGAVRAASVMYVVPLLAILWDYLFLHLVPAWNQNLGALAILIGVILIQYRKRQQV